MKHSSISYHREGIEVSQFADDEHHVVISDGVGCHFYLSRDDANWLVDVLHHIEGITENTT